MKEYTNGEVTVFWDAEKCIHSGNCVKGLPAVFNRKKRPWINMKGASSDEIRKVVDTCPTGALTYAPPSRDREPSSRITVTKNGPLLVMGSCALIDKDGTELARCGPFALCRCGGSKNKPYCDGTHRAIGFDDETVAQG